MVYTNLTLVTMKFYESMFRIINPLYKKLMKALSALSVTSDMKLPVWQLHSMGGQRHNDDIFRVTGPLCGEFTGHRWIPLTKTSDAELWCFLWSELEQIFE